MDPAAFLWPLHRPPLQYPDAPYTRLLAQTLARSPDRTALIFHDQRLTFRELDALANAAAHALARCGVARGDRVALFMSNRPEYVIAFFAIAKLGAVVTPLNPAYREAEVRYQLANAEARAVVVHDALYPIVAAVRGQAPELRSIVYVGRDAPSETVDFYAALRAAPATPPPDPGIDPARDLLALPYSSGTTGLPKGVMLTHRNLLCNHLQFLAAGRISSSDTLLIFLPFYHIYGSMLMGTAIAAGATQVIMERFDLAESLALGARYGVTLYYAVPPVVLALASATAETIGPAFASVRYVMSGAAPLPPELARRGAALTGATFLQGYGLTEAAPLTHLSPVDDPALIVPETIGVAVSDLEDRIVDIETGERTLGTDEVGELIVRGPQVMQGYWHAPEETARALRGDWLYTGDVARRDARGYVTIVDRKKEMIKYKGFGIAPAELEAALFEHPAVADCAVIGKPDTEAGEIPMAFVVVRAGVTLGVEELLGFIAGRLAGYKRIREVEFVDAIPKNPSGKILRRVLKERTRGST
jgi:long-chain acyl-CoA synthetase